MENIRNVCILAHVDHGKTSLADNLLYSNGIISKHSAGDLRHLDSTQEEQERGITMKSSCITLRHLYRNKLKDESESKYYIINLIDSPGHVDFNGEVSSAVKLSDNAFIIVDVVEGVSSQTRTVIQQAWNERLKFILVLNKIDKLITELKLDLISAYRKLELIIQDVHHIIGELISLDVLAEEERTDSILSDECIAQKYDTNPFMPLKGRVIFCSAYHHWGFRIVDFVSKYSDLLDINKLELFKKMWGDFYINSKRKICKGAQANDKKNIFTSLILEPIWNVYNAFGSNDIDKVIHMMGKLDLKVDIKRNARDFTAQITNIRNFFGKWMPLSSTLFDTLIEKCPNPREAINDEKLALIVPNEIFSEARSIIKMASAEKDAPVVVFITKFMFQSSINNNLIGLGRIYSGQIKADMKMFLFTSAFNPLKVSDRFLDARPEDFDEGPIKVYDDDDNDEGDKLNDIDNDEVFVTRVENIYQFLGQDQILLKNGAPAGNIIGITGINQQRALKNVTLTSKCTLGSCLGLFTEIDNLFQNQCNIICVSVEPKKATFFNELQQALHLLERSDTIVKVSISGTGEMLLYAAGEIHLQKIITELTTRIAPHIEIEVSQPIVPFRETVLHRALCDLALFDSIRCLSEELKIFETNVMKTTPDWDSGISSPQQGIRDSVTIYIRLPQKTGMKLCCRVSVHSMPTSLIDWVEKNSLVLSVLTTAIKSKHELSKTNIDYRNNLLDSLKVALDTATVEEREMCENSTDTIPLDYSSMLDQFWTVGNTAETQCNMLFCYVGRAGLFSNRNEDVNNNNQNPIAHTILKGFQSAVKEGPICQEYMKNTVFVVHNIWETVDETIEQGKLKTDDSLDVYVDTTTKTEYINLDNLETFSSLTCVLGQVSSLITKACQTALICHPGARLMIALYKVDLEVRISTYKHLSSIINQLHGQVVRQEVNLGNFIVESKIPVIESFGFGDKLRKKTSGEVSLPQLKTITWEILNCSPLLDSNLYKTIADSAENCDIKISPELVARNQKYINATRQRKGIKVRQQLIECGDKQRTLSKKK